MAIRLLTRCSGSLNYEIVVELANLLVVPGGSFGPMRLTQALINLGRAKLSGVDVNLFEVIRETVRAAVYKKLAVQSEARANFAKITADSFVDEAAHAETSGASLVIWKEAYVARTKEAEQWRDASFRNDAAYQAERNARSLLVDLQLAEALRRRSGK